jgi:hypothetical protein
MSYLGHGNVTLDINHHGTTNWVINSNDFIIPNTTIRVFVAAVVNFFIILFIATLFYEIVFNILIGEISPVFSFIKNKGLSLVKFL